MNILTNESVEDWKGLLNNYIRVIKDDKKSALFDLDAWFCNELPSIVRTQKHIQQKDLSKLMKWKLVRGKSRPMLQKYIDSLNPMEVISASKEAFSLIDKGKIEEALDAICVLKGVGPATASAILSSYTDGIPFMSDEALSYIECGSNKYTKKSFKLLLDLTLKICSKLNKIKDNDIKWNPRLIERCLYTNARDKKRKKTDDEEPKEKKRKLK